MSAQYSIGVSTNRFELFDLGDEDPLELIKKQELEREARKKAKLNEKEKEVKVKAPAPKPKADKKPAKDFQGAHEGVKSKDEALKTSKDDRKGNSDFKAPRSNYRGSQEDREKENYRSREDQDRGGFRDRDGGDRYPQDDGGFKKTSEFSRGRGGGRGSAPVGGPGYRGRTFQRGGGGRSYPEFRGKREFDRQSGSNRTGVKPTEKREGAGGYNWGNSKDDDWNQTNEEELNSSNDKENWDTTNNEHNQTSGPEEWTGPPDNAQWNSDTGNNNANKSVSQTEEPAPVQEGNENPEAPTDSEVPKEELTLDEWKAKKGPKSAPTYNLRKAGEGEDLTQWKKMYALRKKKDEEDDDEEEYEYIDYPQRVGRQRHVLDIDIRYKDSRGSNTGRGRGRGRGAFRGNPERAAPPQPREREREPVNPNAPTKEIPKVDDEHDFPSLS